MARVVRCADWAAEPGRRRGRIQGESLGTGISILFFSAEEIGAGPVLHTHPYDEVFIVEEGRVRYVIGGETVDAEPGDVLTAPAGVPHRFENLGPGRLVTTDIHLSPEVIQTDLETR